MCQRCITTSMRRSLAKNLVSYGAGDIVIRLGTEANGSWEADYIGIDQLRR